jgi:polysaccharide export outer membrane protein
VEAAANATDQPIVWRAVSEGPGGESDEGPAPVRPAAWLPPPRPRHAPAPLPRPDELPRELDKVTMPPYRIEPPDVLLIDLVRAVPRPPYRIEPLDELLIQAPARDVLPNEPINGLYPVDPQGRIDLAYSYGKVEVAGLTVEEAVGAIKEHLRTAANVNPPKQLAVSLAHVRGLQPVRGEHLVRMDGTVGLGVYGDVYVAGLTLAEARQALEAHLARALLRPEVAVDVLGFNSKVYYVIFDGGGFGQQVVRLPIVGGETVLDAIGRVNGLPPLSSTERIWVSRPVPGHTGARQILPVDWAALTEGAATDTNYQLFPGDRVYVKADHWVAFENRVAKLMAPLERLFGFTLLGDAALRSAAGPGACGRGGGG